MSFIALLDYGTGNLLSVSKALEFAGAEIRVVSRPAAASGAAGLVLPGVGNFGDGMRNLREAGFVSFLRDAVRAGTPLLGICLGMQMLLDSSEEAPGVAGLSIFPGKVVRFPARGLKIPQIGWNSVSFPRENRFLKGIAQGSFFYFVHSYYALPEEKSVVAAETEYMIAFAAALSRGNVFASQFHPEKSQAAGLALLRNFIGVCGLSRTK